MPFPVRRPLRERFVEFVGELSAWQIMLLIFWVIGHLLQRNVERASTFFKHQFLNALEVERWEKPACAIVASNAPGTEEIDLFGMLSSRGYLLPTHEIILDDDLPVLVKLPEKLREKWESQSRFRTWE